jgi:hypothetical protein
MARYRKIDNLLFETAEMLPVRAAALREQAAGRPKDEEDEIMDAASAMTRLYGRLTSRARKRWKHEREKELTS